MPIAIAELLRQGTARLKNAGIDDAEISTRLILRHLLDKSNLELQLSSTEIVDEKNIILFNELVEKRSHHVPVQYIIGEVEFYNVKLKVDSRALIPRPETEILVEHLIELAKTIKSAAVLDIGTGSGNIAVALAANIDSINITAIDISQESLDLARKNAEANRVADKIKFVRADCLRSEFWERGDRYDIIASNPPYVDDNDFESLQPEIKLYEPKIALMTGGDSFAFFRYITARATKTLKPKGIICFEVGAAQANRVALIMESNFENIHITIAKDLTGKDRVVIGKTQ